MLSIPVIGTWLTFLVFGGEFPGTDVVGRLYIAHVLLVPGLILALIAAHLALVVKQKHTQFPGPGRTEHNERGVVTQAVPFSLRSTSCVVTCRRTGGGRRCVRRTAMRRQCVRSGRGTRRPGSDGDPGRLPGAR